jgi:hypothetical protein
MNEPIDPHSYPTQHAPVATGRPKKIPEAIIEALRAEFRILVDGDLVDNLMQVEQLAVKTRALFLTMRGVETVMMGRSVLANVPLSNQMLPGVGYGGPNVEQFGASAIRQVVEHLPDVVSRLADALANSPARQIDAIATARRNGMHDMADQLEKRLLAPPAAVDTHTHTEEPPHTQLPTANGTNGGQTHGSAAVGAGA